MIVVVFVDKLAPVSAVHDK